MRNPKKPRCRICHRQRKIVNRYAKICELCEPEWRERREKREQGRQSRQAAYPELIAIYGESCMICGSLPITRKLNVDHNHRSGEIRGLLCFQCNYGLRWFKDSPQILRAAAEYVEGRQAVQDDDNDCYPAEIVARAK